MLKQREAETKLGRAGTSLEVRELDQPPVPVKRDSPKIVRNGMFGCVAGILAAILLMLLVESLRRGFRSIRELRHSTGLPVIGALPGKLATADWKPADVDMDIAAKLGDFLGASGHTTGIVFLGGKRVSYDAAWWLASAVRQESPLVLLVDLDTLDAGLSSVFKVSSSPGLSEAARGDTRVDEILHDVADGIKLVPPGNGKAGVEQYTAVMSQLGEVSSARICCLPPPQQWTFHDQIIPLLDSFVLCVPQGTVCRDEVSAAAEQISAMGFKPRGIIVTNFSPARDVFGVDELRFVSVFKQG
jgi:hypothetical protein